MVAIHSRLFNADQRKPRRPEDDRGDGLRHIADVLYELFEQFPLPEPDVEPLEAETPMTV